MAKFYGKIGYKTESVETKPGVWEEGVVEHDAYGDLLTNTRALQAREDSVNDNITVNNSISIVMDAYAREHFFAIRYIKWAGVLWKVSNVEVQSPRLLLTLGGVYNGPTP